MGLPCRACNQGALQCDPVALRAGSPNPWSCDSCGSQLPDTAAALLGSARLARRLRDAGLALPPADVTAEKLPQLSYTRDVEPLVVKLVEVGQGHTGRAAHAGRGSAALAC